VAIRETQRVWHHNLRRTWRRSKKRALKERATDVIVGMLKLSSTVKANLADRERKALEEQERQREIMGTDHQREKGPGSRHSP
jgi:hypothetical protein